MENPTKPGTTSNATVPEEAQKHHTPLDSSFPVVVPKDDLLLSSDVEFKAFLQRAAAKPIELPIRSTWNDQAADEDVSEASDKDWSDEDTVHSDGVHSDSSTSSLKRPGQDPGNPRPSKARATENAFMTGLRDFTGVEKELGDNQMLTENGDVTNISSLSPLVDAFNDLRDNNNNFSTAGLLENAWAVDPLATLKIIFYTRSIHLGQGEQEASYRCFAWLYENHPQTFFDSLQWLVSPVIEKKLKEKKKKDAGDAKNRGVPDAKDGNEDGVEDDFDVVDVNEGMIEETLDEMDKATSDVEATAFQKGSTGNPVVQLDTNYNALFGMSHGYWKDLLQMLAIAADGQLTVSGDIDDVLKTHPTPPKKGKRVQRERDPVKAKALRFEQNSIQHNKVYEMLQNDPQYRVFHNLVARLFGAQLKEDIDLLNSGKKHKLRKLSQAAKWAPSHKGFHDKKTFVLSSIAEYFYPDPTSFDIPADDEHRERYLRAAREKLRSEVVSPLRKALSVVERDIVAKEFENIQYQRVPSKAMNRYTQLFIKKDHERFSQYVKDVAAGKKSTSGAVLLPSTLVQKVLQSNQAGRLSSRLSGKSFKQVQSQAEAEIQNQLLDGQWKTLVERVRESGTLSSSIAVCDVSGSMTWYPLKDRTLPLHSSIGLSLLISEVTAPPFGGTCITFSAEPKVVAVADLVCDKNPTFFEKVTRIMNSEVGYNTNFVAVFENLILPMALQNKLKQEDMVKQVFVFSDMQFDEADQSGFNSSYDRIKQKYQDAGYEMPKLIFWNLNGHSNSGKPVTVDEKGTALVSGYSQGMLKVLLETGGLDDPEGEEVVMDEEGDEVVVQKQKKEIDPFSVVRKALDHPAYRMLAVVD